MSEGPTLPAFRVDRYDLPGAWENYLSNDTYCLVITATGRGLSFYRYLPFFRVTLGGRYVYLRDLRSGRVWGINHEPPHPGRGAIYEDLHPLVLSQDFVRAGADPPFPLPPAARGFESYECIHGPASTLFRSVCEGIAASLEIVVPREGAGELWEVTVQNRSAEERELAVMPTVNLVVGGGTAMIGNYPTYNFVEWDAAEAALSAANLGLRFYGLSNLHATLAAGERPEGMSTTPGGCYATLLGGRPTNELARGEPIQALLFHRVVLAAGEARAFCFALAAGTDAAETKKRAVAWARGGTEDAAVEPLRRGVERGCGETGRGSRHFERARREVAACWQELLGHFQVELPESEFAEFVNGWLQVEMIQCARWTRGGGERGYRDVLQDAWALATIAPTAACRMLLEALAHQYASGWAPRSYPPLDGPPVGSRRSADSPLWIVPAVAGYARETGEAAFLQEEVGFLAGSANAANAAAAAGDGDAAPVLEHADRAVRYVFGQRGARGLPLFHEGDWNDGLDGAGAGGRGESVWLGMFFTFAAEELAALHDLVGDEARARQARAMASEVRQAVEAHGWDGEYYRQGFTDSGTPLGSRTQREGRIFLLPQAWAVLAGCGDEDKRRSCLAAVERELATSLGPKLLHPPFTERDVTIGRVTVRVPGTSDNAGVQTHAAVMMAAAELAAGRGEEGYRTLRAVTPMNPARRRGVEGTAPFVLNSQTIGPDNPRFGATEIGWLTGAAGWMLRAVGERLLGVRPEFGGLRCDPCVPASWESFGMRRLFRGARYEIRVENPERRTRGVNEVWVNGKRIEGTLVAPARAGETVQVRVVMG